MRWTEPARTEPLLDLDCDPEWEDCDSIAHDVSEDGRTIVGSSGRGGFRWTPEAGALPLADETDPTAFVSDARGVSPNGAWVVGRGFVDGVEQPIRWSEAEGILGLGQTSPFYTPNFHAISDDGRTAIGGASPSDFRDDAWIWTADSGIEPLRTRLEALGHDTHAWRIFGATLDLSADGRTILFTGRPWDSRAPRALLYARLVAPRPGVDLCDERQAGCVTAHVVARSSQLAPSFDVREPDHRLAFGALCDALIDASGRVAFMANVFSPADLAEGYLDPTTLYEPREGRPVLLFDGLYSSDDPDWTRWALHSFRSDSLGIANDGAVYLMANRLAQSRTPGEPVIVRQSMGDPEPQLVLPTPDPLADSEATRVTSSRSMRAGTSTCGSGGRGPGRRHPAEATRVSDCCDPTGRRACASSSARPTPT